MMYNDYPGLSRVVLFFTGSCGGDVSCSITCYGTCSGSCSATCDFCNLQCDNTCKIWCAVTNCDDLCALECANLCIQVCTYTCIIYACFLLGGCISLVNSTNNIKEDIRMKIWLMSPLNAS